MSWYSYKKPKDRAKVISNTAERAKTLIMEDAVNELDCLEVVSVLNLLKNKISLELESNIALKEEELKLINKALNEIE